MKVYIVAQGEGIGKGGIVHMPVLRNIGGYVQRTVQLHQAIEQLVGGPDGLRVTGKSGVQRRDVAVLVVTEHQVAALGLAGAAARAKQ